MDNNISKLQSLVEQIEKLKRPQTEKNIFSIGGRGHYENPVSDILAFFINPKEVHGFRELFLSSLIQCAGLEKSITPELIGPPIREEVTDTGKRIDLIIEGEEWVIVIENKIKHFLNNPFDEYINYMSKKYPDKKKYFILLSIKHEIPPKDWIGISYEKFICQLKKNIGYFIVNPHTTKWYVILREFLLNMQEQIGKDRMDPERINFVKKNYKEIQEIIDMFNEYVEYIKSLIIKTLAGNNSICIRQHNWGEVGIALRISLNHWRKGTNITLVLKKIGGLRIQIYVYDINDDDLELLKKHIDLDKYKDFWIESKTIACFGYFDSDNHEEIFNEIREVTKRINSFYER